MMRTSRRRLILADMPLGLDMSLHDGPNRTADLPGATENSMPRVTPLTSRVAVVLQILAIAHLIQPCACWREAEPGMDQSEVVICTSVYKPYVFPLPGADLEALLEKKVSLQAFREAFQGYDVDLITAIYSTAAFNSTAFSFILHSTYPNSLYNTRVGNCDVALGAYVRTTQRQQCGLSCPQLPPDAVIDNSYVCCLAFSPFYERSGYSVLSSQNPAEDSLWLVAKSLSSTNMLNILCTVVLLLLGSGHLIWYAERNHNPDFPHGYLDGVDDGLWWSVVTLTTVGYGDKSPVTFPGRILGVIWMFTGFVLMAVMGAIITSEQILNQMKTRDITGPSDLYGISICAVGGVYMEFLRNLNIVPALPANDILDCYKALQESQIDAVLFDRPSLIAELDKEISPIVEGVPNLQTIPEILEISPILQAVHYAVAFPVNSTVQPAIESALYHILDGETIFSDSWSVLRQGWSQRIAQQSWLNGDNDPFSTVIASPNPHGPSRPRTWVFFSVTVTVCIIYLFVQFGGLLLRSFRQGQSGLMPVSRFPVTDQFPPMSRARQNHGSVQASGASDSVQELLPGQLPLSGGDDESKVVEPPRVTTQLELEMRLMKQEMQEIRQILQGMASTKPHAK